MKTLLITLLTILTITAQANVLEIHQWTTKNGTPVYFVKSDSLPMLDMAIKFRAGSAYDGKRHGLAQLTNNLIGEGSEQHSADNIAARFDNMGAQLGNSVDRDGAVISLRTLTNKKVMADALSLFTNVLSRPTFPNASVQQLRNQQLVAIQMRAQNPSALASNALYKTIFGESAYGYTVLGQANIVKSFTHDDALRFYAQHYTARNATLAIVGDVSLKQAKAMADTLTKALQPGQLLTAPDVTLSPTGKHAHIKFPGPQATLYIGEAGLNHNNKDYMNVLVGNQILGGGMSSLLFQNVREKHGLSYGVGSGNMPLLSRGIFLIAGQTQNKTTAQAINVMLSTAGMFIAKGPTAAELKQAQDSLVNSFPLRFDSNAAILQNILYLGFYHLPVNYFDTFTSRVKAVKATDIRHAFAKHFHVKQMNVVIVGS
tara:strand:- start:86706 stop:87992 length:1287 start_codon:yes stop_codon:yes gene_type:complete